MFGPTNTAVERPEPDRRCVLEQSYSHVRAFAPKVLDGPGAEPARTATLYVCRRFTLGGPDRWRGGGLEAPGGPSRVLRDAGGDPRRFLSRRRGFRHRRAWSAGRSHQGPAHAP